jgi:hypothetical protein
MLNSHKGGFLMYYSYKKPRQDAIGFALVAIVGEICLFVSEIIRAVNGGDSYLAPCVACLCMIALAVMVVIGLEKKNDQLALWTATVGALAAGVGLFYSNVNDLLEIQVILQNNDGWYLAYLILILLAGIGAISAGALASYAHIFANKKAGLLASLFLEISGMLGFASIICYYITLNLSWGYWILAFISSTAVMNAFIAFSAVLRLFYQEDVQPATPEAK